MTSTRDRLQAHRFGAGRVRAALLSGDAESTERPLGRLGAATYAGILVTIALVAVAGLLGVLRPGNSTAWQQPGAFIVETETGARYVVLDGVLRPVLNYASARLLLGEQLHVVSVSGRSLQPAPRGGPVGIPGAPDALPDAADIVGPSWAVCGVGTAAGGETLRTAILPGVVAAGAAQPAGRGLLLRTPAGRTHLLVDGRAFEIGAPWLEALGYAQANAVPVGDDLVAALPAGRAIEPMSLPGVGEPGPPLPGALDPVPVGTVFADRANEHYVMTAAGLSALTPLQADLLLADPALSAAYAGGDASAMPISQAQVMDATLVPAPDVGVGVPAPATAPPLVPVPPGEGQLCVSYPSGAVTLGPAAPLASTGTVQLATGAGALVAALPDPNSQTAGGTTFLVTDTGTRYPVAGPGALQQLGLAGVPVTQIPSTVIGLLPEGPLLDPAAAGRGS